MNFVESFTERTHNHMIEKSDKYLKELGKLFDEN